MKTRYICIAVLCLFPVTGAPAQTPASAPPALADLSRSLQDLAGKVSPSVVQIFVTGYASPDEEDRAATATRDPSTTLRVVPSNVEGRTANHAPSLTAPRRSGAIRGMSLKQVSRRLVFVAGSVCALALSASPTAFLSPARHFLYVAEPGIRNYVEYGGVGVLVYDMDAGHKFVKRIPTFAEVAGEQPENVKGVAASATTGRLFVSTIKRVAAIDLKTEQILWNRTYEGGADRLAVSPDGKILYVPSLEGPHWHAVDAATGDVLAKIVTDTGGIAYPPCS